MRLVWGACQKQEDKTKVLYEYSLYPQLLAIHAMNSVAKLMEGEILINNFKLNTEQRCMCLHVCEDTFSNVLINSFRNLNYFWYYCLQMYSWILAIPF